MSKGEEKERKELEKEREALEKEYQVQKSQIEENSARMKVLSNLIEGDPEDPEDLGLIGAMLEALTKPAKTSEEEQTRIEFMKKFVGENREFYAICDICNEKFFVVNIKNRSKFKCPTCNSDFEFDRIKMKFFRSEIIL